MLRLVCAAVALVAASPSLRADEAPVRALALASDNVPVPTVTALRDELSQRGIELASAPAQPDPASESALAGARRLYQEMSFAQATRQLEASRQSLIANRLPNASVIEALAAVETWLGALRFLSKDRAGAVEEWTLAQRLSPHVAVEPIFPPEVRAAFAQRRAPARPVDVAVRLAPAGARLWLDGKLATAPVTAAPGLHYVVVERADLVPSTAIVRITRAAPEIAVSLSQPAAPADALRQTAARIASAPLDRDEGLAVSTELHRPLWLIRLQNGNLVAQRFAADDVAHATDEKTAPSPVALADALGTVETRAPATTIAAPVAPVAPLAVAPSSTTLTATAPPSRPLWKRGWFWGVVAGSAAVAAAIIAGSVVGATAARDYDLRVR